MTRLRDSGLDDSKGSVQYCPQCRKQTVWHTPRGGWPICGTCGYNPEMEQFQTEDDKEKSKPKKREWW